MAVYTEDVFAAAKAMGGPDVTALSDLCAVAEDGFTARLKDGETAAGCAGALKQASAMAALAMFRRGEEAAGAASYTAGAVSVTERAGGNGAEGLIKQAEAIMAPYLDDGGFAFRGVRG